MQNHPRPTLKQIIERLPASPQREEFVRSCRIVLHTRVPARSLPEDVNSETLAKIEQDYMEAAELYGFDPAL